MAKQLRRTVPKRETSAPSLTVCIRHSEPEREIVNAALQRVLPKSAYIAFDSSSFPNIEPLLQSIEGNPALWRDMPRSATEAVTKAFAGLDDPLHAAFLTRALNAVTGLAARLSAQAIGDAVGQPSDLAVLLCALGQPEAIEDVAQDDPLAEARLRGARQRHAVLAAEGGTLTVEEVATRLGVTRQAIHRKRQQGRLIAFPIGQHRFVYPAWQFGDSGTLAGLEDVLSEFSVRDPWTIAVFFLSENSSLRGSRPLDELRKGHVLDVRQAAWALGEQGAA